MCTLLLNKLNKKKKKIKIPNSFVDTQHLIRTHKFFAAEKTSKAKVKLGSHPKKLRLCFIQYQEYITHKSVFLKTLAIKKNSV